MKRINDLTNRKKKIIARLEIRKELGKQKKWSTYVNSRSFKKIGGRTVKCRYGHHIDWLSRYKRRGSKSNHVV